MRIEHHEAIAAPVATVWQLTVDVEGWPALMPTVTTVERLDDGPLRVGSRARLKQPGQRPTVWTVTRHEEPHTFAWEAKVFGVPMVATHRIEADGTGCRNTLALDLLGRRGRILGALAGRTLRKTLTTENASFRARAEALTAAAA